MQFSFISDQFFVFFICPENGDNDVANTYLLAYTYVQYIHNNIKTRKNVRDRDEAY